MPKHTVSGTFTITSDPDAVQAFVEAFYAEPDPNIQRALEQSRLSGLEVVMHTGFDDLPWAPVWLSPHEQPVAWLHVGTGERRAENPYLTDRQDGPSTI